MTWKDDTVLMFRLLRVFLAVSLFGIVIITLHNLYINRLDDYFQEKFLIKCGMGMLLIVAFQGMSHFRLRRARHALRILSARGTLACPQELEKRVDLQESERLQAWKELSRYPDFIFKAMLVFGIMCSPPYHLFMLRFGGVREHELQTSVGMYLLENLLFDQALTLMLAALLYIVLRRISRQYMEKLQMYQLHPMKLASIATPLFIQFISLFLISMMTVLWFIVNNFSSGFVHLSELFLLAAATLLTSASLFAIEVFNLRQSLRDLISMIQSLLAKKRSQLHGKMPIATLDEIGVLADSFNRLQERTAQEYQAVENDLRLAYNVQQQLLPKSFLAFGPLEVAGVCLPTKDVGGDFFDVLPLADGKAAVVIGDVTGKGLQAALIMTAVVVLLRAEARRGGTPDQIMNQMNRLLLDTVQQTTYVTLGFALFDPSAGKLEYCSAGHVSPYLLRKGGISLLEASSLPLGVDPSAVYHTKSYDMQSGDRFFFYTDGIIDSMMNERCAPGFEGFEKKLLALDADDHPESQIQAILNTLPNENGHPYTDDKTLVLVRIGRHGE